jgi:hypothetical protein
MRFKGFLYPPAFRCILELEGASASGTDSRNQLAAHVLGYEVHLVPVGHIPGFPRMEMIATPAEVTSLEWVSLGNVSSSYQPPVLTNCLLRHCKLDRLSEHRAVHDQGKGTTTCTWFEYELSAPVESTAVVA